MFEWHTIAQHTGDQLGIVPVFGIELLRKTFHGGLVTTFVLKLEVIALRAVGIDLLNDLTVCHGLGKDDPLLIVLKTREDLIRITVEQADKGHPFLLVVLETYHVALQLLRTNLRHIRTTVQGGVCQCVVYQIGELFSIVRLQGFQTLFQQRGNLFLREITPCLGSYRHQCIGNVSEHFFFRFCLHIKLNILGAKVHISFLFWETFPDFLKKSVPFWKTFSTFVP